MRVRERLITLESIYLTSRGRLLFSSKDKKNSHVYYKVARKLDYREAAAIQAALGSDPIREILTILTKDFSALYETLEEAQKVIAWRSDPCIPDEPKPARLTKRLLRAAADSSAELEPGENRRMAQKRHGGRRLN